MPDQRLPYHAHTGGNIGLVSAPTDLSVAFCFPDVLGVHLVRNSIISRSLFAVNDANQQPYPSEQVVLDSGHFCRTPESCVNENDQVEWLDNTLARLPQAAAFKLACYHVPLCKYVGGPGNRSTIDSSATGLSTIDSSATGLSAENVLTIRCCESDPVHGTWYDEDNVEAGSDEAKTHAGRRAFVPIFDKHGVHAGFENHMHTIKRTAPMVRSRRTKLCFAVWFLLSNLCSEDDVSEHSAVGNPTQLERYTLATVIGA
jgi:hypothetical protein